jgi:CrcB protein
MPPLDPAYLVGVGGALGALARYAVGQWIDREDSPLGTFVVNVLGSFLLGLVTVLGAGNDLALFVGTGACGAFTTFSSFSFETVRLFERGDRRLAIANAGGTLLAATGGVGAAWAVAALV